MLADWLPDDWAQFQNALAGKNPQAPAVVSIEAADDGRAAIEAAVAANWRVAVVVARSTAFDSAFNRRICVVTAFRGVNWNIAAPKRQTLLLSVYDVLRRIGEPGEVEPLSADEQAVADLLPNGFDSETFAGYWPKPLPEINRKLVRLTWRTGCSWFAGEVPIHPTENRPLGTNEQAALFNDNFEPWLNYNNAKAIRGEWESQDWESRYSARSGQFVGRDTSGEQIKRFDLCEYGPEDYGEQPASLPHRHFNQRASGQLIFSWDEIENAYLSKRRFVS